MTIQRLTLETTADPHTVAALRAIVEHLNRQQPVMDQAEKDHPEGLDAPDGTGPATVPLGLIARFPFHRADTLAQHFLAVAEEVGDALTFRDMLLEQVFKTLAKDDISELAGELVVLTTLTTRWTGDIFQRLEDANHADRAGRGTDR